MLRTKRGVSIISLTLCAVAITLVTTALVVATNNSAMFRAGEMAKKESKVVESTAYTKVYTIDEVTRIARQTFANNYLAFYDKEVDLVGFEALVLGEIMETISEQQLDNYNVYVTTTGVTVEHK